uniref:Uncharacterized protein n=1 Tax=Anguilla anguilla TaxID=7936 RepID=A0A0E9QVL5_ANGAN
MEAVDSSGCGMWWGLGSQLPALLHNGEDSLSIPLLTSTHLQDSAALCCLRTSACTHLKIFLSPLCP